MAALLVSPFSDSLNRSSRSSLLSSLPSQCSTCFYWKPVLCLQRAVCTVRLLRRHGIFARLVIGYRPSPFFSHAWVEVDGRVVYGSPAYQKRLKPLHVA